MKENLNIDPRMLKCAKRITELRERHDWTMEQLAEKADIAIGTVHNIEKAVKAPGYYVILKLAELFGESTDYIMGVSDVRRLKKEA